MKACPNPMLLIALYLACLKPIAWQVQSWRRWHCYSTPQIKCPVFATSVRQKVTSAECVWPWAVCLKERTEWRCVVTLESSEKHLCSNHPKPGWSVKEMKNEVKMKSLLDAQDEWNWPSCTRINHHKSVWGCYTIKYIHLDTVLEYID